MYTVMMLHYFADKYLLTPYVRCADYIYHLICHCMLPLHVKISRLLKFSVWSKIVCFLEAFLLHYGAHVDVKEAFSLVQTYELCHTCVNRHSALN